MKKAEFQVCHQIVKELEARGCKILERSVLHLKIEIGTLEVSVSLKNIKAEIALLPKRKEALIQDFVEKVLSNLEFETQKTRRFWPRILPFQYLLRKYYLHGIHQFRIHKAYLLI